VETPEYVVLELELAGIGSRAAAAIYDTIAVVLLFLLVGFGMGLARSLGARWGGWFGAVWILLGFVVVWGYFMIYEGLNNGRTPGKRRVGIRVVMDTGHPVTFGAAAVRNLIRLVDIQPGFTYLVGLLFAFFHSEHKRLGDIVAGTIVVRDRPDNLGLRFAAPPPAAEQQPELGPPELNEDEYRLLAQFLERADALQPAVRQKFIRELADRFRDRSTTPEASPEVFLATLYAGELAKRRGKFGARQAAGRGPRATMAAERFVAQKQDTWERFRAAAVEAERAGLTAFSGDEVVRFAANYREVAADLARARTYGLDARVLEYLERIVSAGHNALYGAQGSDRPSLRRLLFADLPGAVYAARAYVLVAALLFTAPAMAGFVLLRERPALMTRVLPAGMVARAEAGARQQAEGRGYAQAPSPYLPMMASGIIANNVQVAFLAFAFGITAGVGTVAVLALNGLFFGAVLALFANYRLAGWILTFVAGHGVLELTAIFIAGGAGLLVARALVAPGDLARRDALVIHGRRAIRMVGAAACLLLLAGTIEGFLSASDAPLAVKLGVSLASAALLALYFAAGARAARPAAEPVGRQ
jgi:uncharacterized membrane protein SpoIIM required for sporulation/uncharacterized RDD family membrane protein YckC